VVQTQITKIRRSHFFSCPCRNHSRSSMTVPKQPILELLCWFLTKFLINLCRTTRAAALVVLHKSENNEGIVLSSTVFSSAPNLPHHEFGLFPGISAQIASGNENLCRTTRAAAPISAISSRPEIKPAQDLFSPLL